MSSHSSRSETRAENLSPCRAFRTVVSTHSNTEHRSKHRAVSEGVTEAAPHVTLLHPGLLNARKLAVLLIRVLIIHALDHLVPLSSHAPCIFVLEEEVQPKGAHPADSYVR